MTKGRIPSFITTLGTSMIARSLAFVISDGKVIADIPDGLQGRGTGRSLRPAVHALFVVIAVLRAWASSC